jgi:ceramide glucosyltransferase
VILHAPSWLSDVTLALAVASLAYTVLALALVARLRPPHAAEPGATPMVSIIKPLAGLEPQLEANLLSACDQTYPRYEVIFCARDAADPALAVAERVRAARPSCDVRIVSGGGARARNPKIENAGAALAIATGEIVVVADSDMRVDAGYVRAIARAFDDPRVGAVTTLYGARSTGSFAAALGALFVNDQFTPSVLVATALQPLRYCFGATMAVRANVLDDIGGFEAIGATIADDYALGALVASRGLRVAFAETIPLTLVAEPSLKALVAREVRWARTIRSVQPAGYAGSLVTYPIALCVVNLFLAPNALLALAPLALAVTLRLLVHACANARLGVRAPLQPWLVPVREVLSVAVWLCGLVGSRARWRDRSLSVRAEGFYATCVMPKR